MSQTIYTLMQKLIAHTRIFTLALALIALHTIAHTQTTSITKYAPPQALIDHLDIIFKHITPEDIDDHTTFAQKLVSLNFKIIKHDYNKIVAQLPFPLDHFLLKSGSNVFTCKENHACTDLRNINRAFIAHQIDTLIQKHDLQHVRVPKTYLYHIPSAPKILTSENYVVISEKINLTPITDVNVISKNMFQEYLFVVTKTGLIDSALKAKSDNIFFDEANKLVFTDNENALQLKNSMISFCDQYHTPPLKPFVFMTSHNGCPAPVPKEVFFTEAFMLQGVKKNNIEITQQALKILQKIMTCYTGIYPIYNIHKKLSLPYLNMLLLEITTLIQEAKILCSLYNIDPTKLTEKQNKRIQEYEAFYKKPILSFAQTLEKYWV